MAAFTAAWASSGRVTSSLTASRSSALPTALVTVSVLRPVATTAFPAARAALAILLTTVYNCAQIKLTVPRYGCSLWEMQFIISAGDSHDQEQDSEQDTRLSS